MAHRWIQFGRNDLVGLGLLSAVAGWVLISAEVAGGDPSNYVATLAVGAGGYLLGRLTAPWAWAPATAVALGLAWWVASSEGALDGGPLAGPLGYANANAAFAVQVSGALLVASAWSRTFVVRLAFATAAVLPLALTWTNRSAAAAVGGILLIAAGLAVAAVRPRSGQVLAALVGVTVLCLAIVAQVVVALDAAPREAESALSDRRVALWGDAVSLAGEEPITGHGPQSFSVVSPTAAADDDTRAAHSVLLEVAAEAGWVGAAFLMALIAWVYLAVAGASAGPGIVGSMAWTAFGLHSLVDYVADFPWVVGVAGLVAGLAVGPWRLHRKISRSATTVCSH